MSNLQELQQRALHIKQLYSRLNLQAGRSEWTAQDYAMGFVGDVGDLQKLVMARAGKRHVDDVDAKLAHELSDCLWSLLILANQYDINLEDVFSKTMNELELRIESQTKDGQA
jgi:NTP pyrophosphatase (non-canonical NTP hydrolase)